MSTARATEQADAGISTGAKRMRMLFQPAGAEVGVRNLRRIWVFGWHAKVNRYNQDALSGQRLIQSLLCCAVHIRPGAAMHVEHRGDRLRPFWAIHTCQQRQLTMTLILDVFHLNFELLRNR
jgi:hypothetical protein